MMGRMLSQLPLLHAADERDVGCCARNTGLTGKIYSSNFRRGTLGSKRKNEEKIAVFGSTSATMAPSPEIRYPVAAVATHPVCLASQA
jgi:hypothetical protein